MMIDDEEEDEGGYEGAIVLEASIQEFIRINMLQF